MQFLPGTWRVVGTDLTGDGTADPHNIFDAAASAATYLCRSGPNLADPGRLRAAVLTYNRSQTYADIVLERAGGYAASIPLG
jgi:membrane-bound lytic murein transglycosylase B